MNYSISNQTHKFLAKLNIERRDVETQSLSFSLRLCVSAFNYSTFGLTRLILSLVFIGILFSCKNDPPSNESNVIKLPTTPEGVCRAWQQYVDNNEIAKAMLLGSPAAKEWLTLNQSLFLADDEVEPTKFISLTCTEKEDKAICKYTLTEEGDLIEDYFSLVRRKSQWLIHIEDQEGKDPNEAIFNEMKRALDLN